MSPYVTDAGSFLVSVVFGLFVLAVLLRFLLQVVRADFYNPISQGIVTLTTPVLRPLRRVIPGFRGLDVPALVAAVVLQLVELWLLMAMRGNPAPSPVGLSLLAVVELAKLAYWIFMISILVQVVLSWVAPGAYNPATQLLYSLSRPILQPARRLLPPMGGIDLSPMLAIVFLVLVYKLPIAILRDLAYGLLR